MKAQLEQYMSYLQLERRLSPNSLSSYERDLQQFYSYMAAQDVTEWTEVQRGHLARYMLLLKEQGRKAATISRHIVSVRAFFHHLSVRGVILSDPSIHMEAPKQERKAPTVLTVDDTNMLLDCPKTSSCAGKRDKAMLELLYATGIRVTELVSLNVEHLHLHVGYIECVGAGQKERIVPFGSHAKAALTVYMEEGRSGLLTGREPASALFLNHLGTRMTRQGFWKMLKKYAREAGVMEAITPHTLRHSVASHMLDNGADVRAVQELLGHSDVATTMKYTQSARGRLKDAYVSAHPRA
ncbi:site-specific tyrosine recombinase XerD [Paenibacillus sp. PL2-23]|uniref:site-specific tyrosine recombinase XerD n=1 Tax=Paenibacillus sp. PL2-23 TaxID=2100729 RepID=UPI0030F9C2A0